MTIPATALRPIAQRMVNAENAFIEFAKTHGGLTEAEAIKVLNIYIKHKIVKLDPIMGTFRLVHGKFGDKGALAHVAAK